MVQKMPQNTALLAKLQGTGFAGMAPKKPVNGAGHGPASAGGPEIQPLADEPKAPVAESAPEVPVQTTHEAPLEAEQGAGIPPLGDPEPLAPQTTHLAPFIPPLPTTFPPAAPAGTPVSKAPGGVNGQGKGGIPGLADFNTVKDSVLGPLKLASFSVEKRIFDWVRTESAREDIPAADLWREALSTPITAEWWGEHFNKDLTPDSYLRARHKASARERTTTLIPESLFNHIEATRMSLLETFESVGPTQRSQLFEVLIVKWALEELPNRDAKKATIQ